MTTRLEILNHVLNVVGETPVSSPSSQHPTALSASVEIDRVNKELQKRGWWFNTEYDLLLSPNDIGEVIVPAGVLFLAPTHPESKLIRRGTRIYDPTKHTYILNNSIKVDAIVQLPIEDLPESAAMWLQHKVAYDFYVNDDGDSEKSSRLQDRVTEAWAELQKAELKASKVTAMNRPITAVLRSRISRQGVTYSPMWPGGRR